MKELKSSLGCSGQVAIAGPFSQLNNMKLGDFDRNDADPSSTHKNLAFGSFSVVIGNFFYRIVAFEI